MATEHTPEPWRVFDRYDPLVIATDKEGISIATLSKDWSMPMEANARRIVACVNKLAEWSDEQLADSNWGAMPVNLQDLKRGLDAVDAGETITLEDFNKILEQPDDPAA